MSATSVPIKQRTVSQTTVVLEQIRDDIIYGRLDPGAKLKIEVLQQRYSSGATPLREALSLLSMTGLVERIEQRGFRVARVSAAEYAEILWTRCFVEERALRESILHGTREWEEQIVLAQYHLQKASETLPNDDQDGNLDWERWHREFHSALIGACPSKSLLRFCAQLYDENNRYRYIARLGMRSREGAFEEHKRIADAALKRDKDLAASLLLEHYRKTGDLLHDRLEGFDPKTGHRPNLRIT
jgi:DNA-binding GntR family transcriptional regulator